MNLRKENLTLEIGSLTADKFEAMMKDPNNILCKEFQAARAKIELLKEIDLHEAMFHYREKMRERVIEDENFIAEQAHKAKEEAHFQEQMLADKKRLEMQKQATSVVTYPELMPNVTKLLFALDEMQKLKSNYTQILQQQENVTNLWRFERDAYAQQISDSLVNFEIELKDEKGNPILFEVNLPAAERAEIAERLRARELPLDALARLPEMRETYEQEVARQEAMIQAERINNPHQESALNAKEQQIQDRKLAEARAQNEMNLGSRTEMLDLINCIPAIVAHLKQKYGAKNIQDIQRNGKQNIYRAIEILLRKGNANRLANNGAFQNNMSHYEMMNSLNTLRTENTVYAEFAKTAYDKAMSDVSSLINSIYTDLSQKQFAGKDVKLSSFKELIEQLQPGTNSLEEENLRQNVGFRA